jgi:site-specific DNA-cytosine methylase
MSESLCYDGYNQSAHTEVSMTLRSANGGGEREVSPTLSHQPSALEPTVATQTGEQVNATHKTNPGEILRLLRETLGEKAFQEWRTGINAKLQQEEVLQHKMRGQRPFGETAHGDELGGHSLPCAKDCPIGALCPMRKTECIGCSPQRRESAEQQPIQSNSTLPKLSYPYSPTEGQMCDLWQTDEGAWILQQALDKISQIRESVMVQRQRGIGGILAAMRYIVRRLTPKEAERLMGLPDGYTIPVGLDPNDPALVAEFQRIFDEFGAIMAAYEGGKPPKPKTAAQVQKWLAKITDPATCPDSPRYKGCGNGWATNQPRWILTRLLNAEDIDPFNN